jgi:hypothetical protein
MMLRLTFVVFAAVALAGCVQVTVFGRTVNDPSAAPASAAPEVSATSAPPQAVAAPASAAVVSAFTLTIAPEGLRKIGDDARFDAEALRRTVEAELLARRLLGAQDPRAHGTAEIRIDDYALRAKTNAVVFGSVPSVGMLAGDVRVVGVDGTALQTFRVAADANLRLAPAGKEAGGTDAAALRALYQRFAVLAADRLAGTPSQPVEGPVIPR